MSIAMFPGQGSQFVGMGKDLHENFSVFRETLEEASDAISLDLKKLCFEGPESDLTLTENTQPALLTTSVGCFRVAQKETGFEPKIVLGHSLGEYSALVANETLSLTNAVRWVRFRGQVMQKAVPAGAGTMAAVLGLENEQVTQICEIATNRAKEEREKNGGSYEVDAVVSPANFNAPGQVVIAGSTDAVELAVKITLEGTDSLPKGKAKLLSVSAPFHCGLMQPARDEMANLFSSLEEGAKPKSPVCPYIPNRTAQVTSEPGVVLELLIEQVDHPVQWTQSVQTLIQNQFKNAVEFGPGKVLQGLVKRIIKTEKAEMTLNSCHDLEHLKALETSK